MKSIKQNKILERTGIDYTKSKNRVVRYFYNKEYYIDSFIDRSELYKRLLQMINNDKSCNEVFTKKEIMNAAYIIIGW